MNYNRYAYCLNNPLMYTDPSGYKWNWNWLNPVHWLSQGMQWINDNTTGLRQTMTDIGVPAFNVGYNTSDGSFHSFGNGANIYHNQFDPAVNANRSINEVRLAEGVVNYNPAGQGGSDFDNWWANTGTAIGLTAQWMFYGEQNRTFNNDRVANAFRNSRIVGEARDFWYKKVNSGKPITVGVTNFRGIQRLGGGNFGLTGLWKAGFDPIEQFVGSTHDFSISSNGSNLTYTITNVTSFRSLMYGKTPEWLNFYNTTQTYIFTEPIDFNKINK
jgi:hypothetical protein